MLLNINPYYNSSGTGRYRYGFNGMEKDDAVKGSGNSYTTEFRQYDPRLGRWLSLDPLLRKFPWQSPYVAYNNNPIYFVDPNGLAATGKKDKEPKMTRREKKFKEKVVDVIMDEFNKNAFDKQGNPRPESEVNKALKPTISMLNEKYKDKRWFREGLAKGGLGFSSDAWKSEVEYKIQEDLYSNILVRNIVASNFTEDAALFRQSNVTVGDPNGIEVQAREQDATDEEYSKGFTNINIEPAGTVANRVTVFTVNKNGQRDEVGRGDTKPNRNTIISVPNSTIVDRKIIVVVSQIGSSSTRSTLNFTISISAFKIIQMAPIIDHSAKHAEK